MSDCIVSMTGERVRIASGGRAISAHWSCFSQFLDWMESEERGSYNAFNCGTQTDETVIVDVYSGEMHFEMQWGNGTIVKVPTPTPDVFLADLREVLRGIDCFLTIRDAFPGK